MKQLNPALGLIALMLAFFEYRPPSAVAQTAEPSQPTAECQIDNTIIWHIAFSSDGQYISANWPEHSVRVWNAKTGATIATLTDARIDSFTLFAFSPDNKYLITGRESVVLWDITSGKKVRTFSSQENKAIILSLSLSADGHSILATYPATGHSAWDLDSGVEQTYLPEQGSVYSEWLLMEIREVRK